MEFSRKRTGVGSHSLLQEIFATQGLNLGFPHCRRVLYHLSHEVGNSAHTEQVTEKRKSLNGQQIYEKMWVIKEQMKTTVRYYFIPSAATKTHTKCWWRREKNIKLMRKYMETMVLESNWAIPNKLRNCVLNAVFLVPKIHLQKGVTVHHGHMYKNTTTALFLTSLTVELLRPRASNAGRVG